MENRDILDSPFGDNPQQDRRDEESSNGLSEELSVSDLREARLHEYELTSRDKSDPLEALLTLTTSGLFRMAHDLEACILKSLSQSEKDLRAFKSVSSALDAQLRLTRQIDRFAQFELRLTELRAKLAMSHKNRDPLRDYARLQRGMSNLEPTFAMGEPRHPR